MLPQSLSQRFLDWLFLDFGQPTTTVKQTLRKVIWNSVTRSTTLWCLDHLPIRKGRVLFYSRGGECYTCNPRVMAEYIASDPELRARFDSWFAFQNPECANEVPSEIRTTTITTLEYYYVRSTSQFLVCNQNFWIMEGKRRQQIYIQTMHGGHGIKKFGLDAEMYRQADKLHEALMADGDRVDLALSDSSFFTEVIRRAYNYHCEVLEKGLPRNDVFFSEDSKKSAIRQRVLSAYDVPNEARTLIYAPTFREVQDDGDLSIYGFDPDRVVAAFEKRFGGTWYVLVSSHPLMRPYYHRIYDFTHPRMRDLGEISDVQELLMAGDALITDYSSIEMDFSLTGRPVFQLARDLESYDRGLLLDPRTLPFPFAASEEELVKNIESFDEQRYARELMQFNHDVIGLKESGHATQEVVEWMLKKL